MDVPATRASHAEPRAWFTILRLRCSRYFSVPPIISTDDLSVTLGGVEVVRAASIAVEKGTLVGLVGPNGSGKTTLLRAIAGLQPYRGRIFLDGRSLAQWTRRGIARRVAFVRQFHALPFDFRVEELVLLGRTPHKRWLEGYHADDLDRVTRALSTMEVSRYRHRSARQLSGGELQRVLLAQALVQEADILLLDEPTAHLDIHHQYAFLEAVRRQVEAGHTAVTVFHDLELASRFASNIIVLKDGRVAAAGPGGSVLSEELLASVFRMNARVEPVLDAGIRIEYLGVCRDSGATASQESQRLR